VRDENTQQGANQVNPTEEPILSAPVLNDVLRHEPLLTVELLGREVPVDPDEWRAWTGRRWSNGVEHHGLVYNLGTDVVYTGRRACGCDRCTAATEPRHRPN
jgi:hypothetical protein